MKTEEKIEYETASVSVIHLEESDVIETSGAPDNGFDGDIDPF